MKINRVQECYECRQLVFAVLLCLLSNVYAANPEFDGECPMALSEGKEVATNCSVFWVAPDDKLYCFFNQGAKEQFLQSPKENLTRAQAFWENSENLKRLIRKE